MQSQCNNQRRRDVSFGSSRFRPNEIFKLDLDIKNNTEMPSLKIFKSDCQRYFEVWVYYPKLKIMAGLFGNLNNAKLYLSKVFKTLSKRKLIFFRCDNCDTKTYYPSIDCNKCMCDEVNVLWPQVKVINWEIDQQEIQKQPAHIGFVDRFQKM
jgi:hypothetical protein